MSIFNVFNIRFQQNNNISIKPPDKSPDFSPESSKKRGKLYSHEFYEEKPNFNFELKRMKTREENENQSLYELNKKHETENKIDEEKKDRTYENSKEILIMPSVSNNEFPTSSQELKIFSDDTKNEDLDKQKPSTTPKTLNTIRTKNSEIFEHFKKLEKKDSEGDDEIESIKGKTYKRDTKKRKTKYRDHIQYKRLKLFFPDDNFKQRWDFFILLLLLYSITLLPYRIAFTVDYISLTDFDYFVDACFMSDVILNFFCCFYDDEGNLVIDRKTIVRTYLSGWFLIDLATSLPLEVILESQPRINNFGKLLRLPRFYSLLRMIKVLRLLRFASAVQGKNNLSKFMNKFFKKNTGNSERVIFSVLGIFLCCHFVACFWYLLSDIEDDPDNWVSRFGYSDKSQFELYIASFYWTIQTVVTVGYGDINPFTYAEHIFAIVWMFFGVFVYSMTVGSVSATLTRMDKKSKDFHEKMEVLFSIQKDYKIGNRLFFKIKNQLKYGKSIEQDYKNFVEYLPNNLNLELSIIMNEEIINSIPFLKNKPSSFVASICSYLKPIKIHRKDYICLEGDPADEVFFIKSGKVAIVLPEYKDFEIIKINSGFYFGELDILFYSEIRMYTYKAIKDTELLVLHTKEFNQLFFSEFKEIGVEFLRGALSRKRKTKKVFKEAVCFCEQHFKTFHPEYTERLKEKNLKKNTLLNLTGIKNFGSSRSMKFIPKPTEKNLYDSKTTPNHKSFTGPYGFDHEIRMLSSGEIDLAKRRMSDAKSSKYKTILTSEKTKTNFHNSFQKEMDKKMNQWEKRIEGIDNSVKKMIELFTSKLARKNKRSYNSLISKSKHILNENHSNEMRVSNEIKSSLHEKTQSKEMQLSQKTKTKLKLDEEDQKISMIKNVIQKYKTQFSESFNNESP